MKDKWTILKSGFVLLSVLVSLCSAQTLPVLFQQGQGVKTTEPYVNLYAEADVRSVVLGVWDDQTQATVLSQKGNWLNIVLPNGKKGWVPIEKVAALSPDHESQNEIEIVEPFVTLKDEPSIYGYDVVSVRQNQRFTVIEQNSEWLRIEVEGKTGWIQAGNVQFVSQTVESGRTLAVERVNLKNQPSESALTTGVISQTDPVSVLDEQKDWVFVQSNDKSGWVPASAFESQPTTIAEPSTKSTSSGWLRASKWGLLLTGLTGASASAYFYKQGEDSFALYEKAMTPQEAVAQYDETLDFDQKRNISAIAAGVSIGIYALITLFHEDKTVPQNISVGPAQRGTAGVAINIIF